MQPHNLGRESFIERYRVAGAIDPLTYDWEEFFLENNAMQLLMRPIVSIQDAVELDKRIRGLIIFFLENNHREHFYRYPEGYVHD